MIEITPLYALPLALMLFLLWLKVVRKRSATDISIGFGNDDELHEKIRRHGNFTEFVPLVLIVMLLAELRVANDIALHVTGVLLVVSRAFHPYGIFIKNSNHVFRIVGNTGSLIALFVAAGAIVATYQN